MSKPQCSDLEILGADAPAAATELTEKSVEAGAGHVAEGQRRPDHRVSAEGAAQIAPAADPDAILPADSTASTIDADAVASALDVRANEDHEYPPESLAIARRMIALASSEARFETIGRAALAYSEDDAKTIAVARDLASLISIENKRGLPSWLPTYIDKLMQGASSPTKAALASGCSHNTAALWFARNSCQHLHNALYQLSRQITVHLLEDVLFERAMDRSEKSPSCLIFALKGMDRGWALADKAGGDINVNVDASQPTHWHINPA